MFSLPSTLPPPNVSILLRSSQSQTYFGEMRLSRSTNEYHLKSEEGCTLKYNSIEKVREVLGRITSPQHERY